jgi:hypothetical protein
MMSMIWWFRENGEKEVDMSTGRRRRARTSRVTADRHGPNASRRDTQAYRDAAIKPAGDA